MGEQYNYLTPEHKHNDGTFGRDMWSTDRQATLHNSENRISGLPRAQDAGEKSHLERGRDY
jgi:hypothetical protein